MHMTRPHFALAASVAALMIAAPMAFHLGRSGLAPPAGTGGEAQARKEVMDFGRIGGDAKRSATRHDGTPPTEAAPPAANALASPDADKVATVVATPEPARQPPKLPRSLDEAKPDARNLPVAKSQPGSSSALAGGAMERLRGMVDRRESALQEQGETVEAVPLPPDEFRDKFDSKPANPVKRAAEEPVSTFSLDVDTASYAFVRRALNAGHLPPKDAIRIEELINYFPYAYPRPATSETPFQPTVTVLPAPWNPGNLLVHVGIKGFELTATERPRANLVLLMDISGSMEPADRLPLVKAAFGMLVEELKPDDTVAIVTYASGSGVLLEPTKVADKGKIAAAIGNLQAGGSTAGAQGIQDAYRLAEANFDPKAVNRVILATDGDFNVGITNEDELKGFIERKRDKGVYLSVIGVGEGNYNDALMQKLAQNGNGTAAYVDTLNEARKVLVDEASSTLFTIARDVKVQIEWNPARVAEYRLIGYESRILNREDFNNDKVDAGDVGSGHTVTAIYEVTPVGSGKPLVDDLRYGGPRTATGDERANLGAEMGFLKLRYKLPKDDTSKLVSLPIPAAADGARLEQAAADTRFSIAVSAFGQLLKGSPYIKDYTYNDVVALAQSAKGDDPFGYRGEFINLVRLAKSARP